MPPQFPALPSPHPPHFPLVRPALVEEPWLDQRVHGEGGVGCHCCDCCCWRCCCYRLSRRSALPSSHIPSLSPSFVHACQVTSRFDSSRGREYGKGGRKGGRKGRRERGGERGRGTGSTLTPRQGVELLLDTVACFPLSLPFSFLLPHHQRCRRMQAYGRNGGRVGASAADASFSPPSLSPFFLESWRCLLSALLPPLPPSSIVNEGEACQRGAIKGGAEGGGEGGRGGRG